jgi:hypothetical protein
MLVKFTSQMNIMLNNILTKRQTARMYKTLNALDQ